MNTYTIIVRFYNSTAIEVEADSLDSAKDIAFNKFYEEGYLGDLCNPNDVTVEVEAEDEYELEN